MMLSFLNFPKNEKTYQEYLKEKEDSVNSALLIRSQGIVIDFLNSTEIYYGCYKENTRIRFRQNGSTLYRESLDEEVYQTIVDILENRPPNIPSIRKWGTESCDWSSWWTHEVCPFLPLSLLLHLHLPLRSAHILNLDRDNFLMTDSKGDIRGYYINTDKNTSRKEGYVIPNIYKDNFKIYKNLIELNKKMFPNLQKVKYQNDKNSPWAEFYPLFPNFDGDNVMSKNIYEKYFKIVVLTAQLELYKKGKKIRIAWMEGSNAFPFSQRVIENHLTIRDLNKFKLSFGLHSLRVTGATRLLRMGLPPQLIKLFTGHKGINTLINIYLKIPEDELINNFFTIQDNINTKDIESLEKVHPKIPHEIIRFIPNLNPEAILIELKKHHLFTMRRIVVDERKTTNTRVEVSNGLEEISKIHWTHWNSFSFGICGKPDGCPIGAENRCSLCPYLVTGPLYLQGIVAKTEQVQKRIFVQSNIIAKNRKENKHSQNKTLHKQQSHDLEELAGWYEIITRIENIIQEPKTSTINKKDLIYNTEQQLIFFKSVSEVEGLIQIYEKAKKLNLYNPDIEDTVFRLSSKIIRWCMTNSYAQEVEEYIDNPEKVIEWFIPNLYYKNKVRFITSSK